MSFLAPLRILRCIPFFILALCFCVDVLGQEDYHIAQYTSRHGLPQNSINGLAFDEHGFLWLATEGGLARFDGRSFRVMDTRDHADLKSQRLTHLLKCNDGSILIIDQLNGMYQLANNRFSTLQHPDIKNNSIHRVTGNPPGSLFFIQDSFFLAESLRTQKSVHEEVFIFPVDSSRVYIISDRIVQLDLVRHERKILQPSRAPGIMYAVLDKDLLHFGPHGQLSIWQAEANAFLPCLLTDSSGKSWNGSFAGAKVYSAFPFTEVFFHDGKKLYEILPTEDSRRFILTTVLDKLPENCFINAMAYRKEEELLVLGTDSRGVFVYQRKHFNTLFYQDNLVETSSAYYAQCMLDSTSLLASNSLIIDIDSDRMKGLFPHPFILTQLCKDDQGDIYFTHGTAVYRHTPKTGQKKRISTKYESITSCIVKLDSTIWLGSTRGIGYIKEDSLNWVHTFPIRRNNHGIKCLLKDDRSNLWFGSLFQLYRLNPSSHQLDSFPQLDNADCRALALIRNKIFIGTYGRGYFIYHDDRMVRMPIGRNNEMLHAHTFVEDSNGYLWISTNRGLYKTHLDAVDAYLQDTTLALDYYAYYEEDGIRSTEFNGGCNPAHLWLPDGRLSLPTMEGLVMFHPAETPHYFTKDTILFEAIEVDGRRYPAGQTFTIPANHNNITIYFACAWWNRPYNQYIAYKLEGVNDEFRLSAIDQASYSIGHLKPGKYTFILRRRCDFGPQDFVYSRQQLIILEPWYARTWALLLMASAFLLIVWGTSILYTRSIRKRNLELQRKVAIQTAALQSTNTQLEENLRKLEASELNLRKNIRVRDRLISIITHDILTPLRFIGQIARLGAEDKPEDPGMPKRALTDVQNAIRKLFHSTQNLLHWVAYQQEKFKTVSIHCSPFTIVEQLMEDFREMSRFQGNTLLNEVPEDDVILTDPNVLTIILHNLLSNAIKYTHQGRIVVRSRIEQNWYLLEVSDNGRGMTPAQLESIRKGTALQGNTALEDITAGNGIGLTLVADLMRSLHGRWEIDSPEGRGVKVSIFLSLDQKLPV